MWKSVLIFITFFTRSVYSQCTTISLVYGYAPEPGQNGNNGYIENNRGPNNRYYRNESCGWQVTVAKGSLIRFVFQSVEVEYSPHCENDWVEIRDGFEFSNSITGRICNASFVGQWFYTTDCVGFVYFQTNNFVERRGFTIYWEKVAAFIAEPAYFDMMNQPAVRPIAVEADLYSLNNTTTEMQQTGLSWVISMTSVVGVTFGIALVVVTGILICVVFPRKRDLGEKVVANFEICKSAERTATPSPICSPYQRNQETQRLPPAVPTYSNTFPVLHVNGHHHHYARQASEDMSSVLYENMPMVGQREEP